MTFRGLVLAAPALAVLAAHAGAQQPTPAPAPPPPQPQPQPAQPREARTHPAVRATTPVRVDAVLDEEGWARAPRIDVPYEFFPGDNAPAPVETDCRVLYDGDNLYLGCTARDPEPGAVRATLSDRDPAPVDDFVELTVDPFDDQRRAFVFRVNPLGVQADASFTTGAGEDASWDAIWRSAGRLTAEGYVVEAAIPFRSFRFPSTAGPQTWGMIVGRNYPRSVRHRLRSMPTDRNEACTLCQAEKLAGLEGIRPGRDLEFTPTLTTRRSDARPDFPAGPMTSGDVSAELGISGRWGITPNVSLNGTVNPDFSQVEADAAQFRVNERFALFYPEKRPFFLEGADLFATPTTLVYTRTVIEPRAGLKVTGKEGGTVFGGFAAQDRTNSLLFPSNQGTGLAFLDDDVNSAVLRVRRDLGRASTVGALYTGRQGTGYHNHVGGVDAYFRLTPTNILRVEAVRSETAYPDSVAALYGQREGSFGGNSLFVELLHQDRDWVVDAVWKDLSPGFRADAGFVPRVDVRGLTATAERVFWGAPGRWYRRLSALLFAERLEDHEGEETDRGFALVGTYSGPLQSDANLGMGYNRKRVADRTFELLDVRTGFAIRPSGRFSFSVSGRFGEDIDYANVRKAGLLELYPGFELRVGRNLTVGLEHAIRRLETLAGDSAGGNREIVGAGITEARAVYHFNARTFVRGIAQYQRVTQDPLLFVSPVAPEERTLYGQLLFAYKLNPQTVLFLGYTDDRLGLQDVDLTPTGRTFFMKLGYNVQL